MCVCARARVCVCVCMRACVCVCMFADIEVYADKVNMPGKGLTCDPL